jgi:hypothetical protein
MYARNSMNKKKKHEDEQFPFANVIWGRGT